MAFQTFLLHPSDKLGTFIWNYCLFVLHSTGYNSLQEDKEDFFLHNSFDERGSCLLSVFFFCKINGAGVKELMKQLPNCRGHWCVESYKLTRSCGKIALYLYWDSAISKFKTREKAIWKSKRKVLLIVNFHYLGWNKGKTYSNISKY